MPVLFIVTPVLASLIMDEGRPATAVLRSKSSTQASGLAAGFIAQNRGAVRPRHIIPNEGEPSAPRSHSGRQSGGACSDDSTWQKATIDILDEAPDVELVALFAPEHGVRGDITAGATVGNTTDPATGVKVYSLYGATKKPTPEMLSGIDALVYDIQDNGCRSYTFISTMAMAMEQCARLGKEFVVLDRPNPLGGNKIEQWCGQ